jgi:hypothetical protein
MTPEEQPREAALRVTGQRVAVLTEVRAHPHADVDTVAAHLLGGVRGEVLERAFGYWKNLDGDTGKQIEEEARGPNGA